jgi:hypothetical protein
MATNDITAAGGPLEDVLHGLEQGLRRIPADSLSPYRPVLMQIRKGVLMSLGRGSEATREPEPATQDEVLAELLESFDRATAQLDSGQPWLARLLRLRHALAQEADLPESTKIVDQLDSIPTISHQALSARRRKHQKGDGS